jgi:hypothetical protein
LPAKLKKKGLTSMVAESLQDIPPEITETVMDIIIDRIAQSLADGQEVTLRGFGRIIPRHYQNTPSKKLGLLFHPSPTLTESCNKKADIPPDPLEPGPEA